LINRHPVVAVSKRSGQVLAVGADARRMLDRVPADIIRMPTLRNRRRRARSTRLFAALSATMVLLSVASEQPWAFGARDAARSRLAQVTSAMSALGDQVDRFTTIFGNTAQLQAENARLRTADEQLRAQLLQLNAVAKENAALRLALDFERPSGYHTVAAQVVARGPDGFSLTMQIDRGTAAGVRPGMVVVTGAGLLGRITEAGSRYAIVQTLADPWSRVDVTLVNSNLQATVSGGTTTLRIAIQNPAGVAVANGDWALTNGSDGTYPRGLVVGELSHADRVAWVNDPPSVTFVLVITDYQPS
jgi:rod shape-determining protein MreC